MRSEGLTLRRPWLAGAGAAVGFAALLFLLRPVSPFEWDEVLFLRALDRYDVGVHSPHPPGYPAYVGAARALRAAVGDPLLALQLVSLVAALVTLVAGWRLAARLGARRGAQWVAAALVAATPGFVFNANVGLSDVPGAAAVVVAALLLVRSLDEKRWLAPAAGAVAFALAIRPQLVAALLPLGVWTVVRAARRRELGAIAFAGGAGLAVSLTCWLPAVLVTGPARFLDATRKLAAWMGREEAGYRLPGAPLDELAVAWLVRPFGTVPLAVTFWSLVALGSWQLWRSGRRRWFAVAAMTGGVYLLLAVATLNFTTSVRYILPGLPFLALLGAGVMEGELAPRWRRAAAVAVAVWSIASIVWCNAALRLRAREAAPAWAALRWVAEHDRPKDVTVVVPDGLKPHADYLLRPLGFDLVPGESLPACPRELRPQGDVVVLLLDRQATTPEPEFERFWRSLRLRRLARERYYLVGVYRLPVADRSCDLHRWNGSSGRWSIERYGVIERRPSELPATIEVRAVSGDAVVEQGGFRPTRLRQGESMRLAVYPGASGGARLAPADGRGDLEVEVGVVPPPSRARGGPVAFVVPQVAHAAGFNSAEWRSDVAAWNVGEAALEARAIFHPAAGGRSPQSLAFSIAPRSGLRADDVLGTRFRGELGFLVIERVSGDGSPEVFARTYNRQAFPGDSRCGEGMPGWPEAMALTPGATFHVHGLTVSTAQRARVAVASLAREPVQVRVRWLGPDGQTTWSTTIEVPALGLATAPIETTGVAGALEFEVISTPSGARVYPMVSVIDNATGMPVHVLPDEVGASLRSALEGDGVRR